MPGLLSPPSVPKTVRAGPAIGLNSYEDEEEEKQVID